MFAKVSCSCRKNGYYAWASGSISALLDKVSLMLPTDTVWNLSHIIGQFLLLLKAGLYLNGVDAALHTAYLLLCYYEDQLIIILNAWFDHAPKGFQVISMCCSFWTYCFNLGGDEHKNNLYSIILYIFDILHRLKTVISSDNKKVILHSKQHGN